MATAGKFVQPVDFFKMAAVAMEMAKMLKKNKKHKNDHTGILA
jgi:hypothetical protein